MSQKSVQDQAFEFLIEGDEKFKSVKDWREQIINQSLAELFSPKSKLRIAWENDVVSKAKNNYIAEKSLNLGTKLKNTN